MELDGCREAQRLSESNRFAAFVGSAVSLFAIPNAKDFDGVLVDQKKRILPCSV